MELIPVGDTEVSLSVRVGINGFGRMGRLALRAGWAASGLELVHINELKGGAATAAHLDYRLMRQGVFVNPITALRSVPPADPVPESEMVAFVSVRDRAMAAFSTSRVARVSDRNATVQ